MAINRTFLRVAAIASLFHLTISTDFPKEGCFWTGNCLSIWGGGCGEGRVVVGKSESCGGLCMPPQYPACSVFATHFQCCNLNKPRVNSACGRCEQRLDMGNAYLCCEDCSEPSVANQETGEGFCRTGSHLAITLKRSEPAVWWAGSWGNCSSTCGGGTRQRPVECRQASSDPASHPEDLSVSNDRCGAAMPPVEEACNLHPCPPRPKAAAKHEKQAQRSDPAGRRGSSGWLFALYSFLGVAVLAGIGFGGYVYYQRHIDKDQGIVYVMLEGYT
eukprot:TRINITY_DN30440_c0_g1_i1.p1 TRINITY_DN30440_c0_g1~~TRINITY_DN30440_c0_g1_i1.p1  ORF type:complete len:283 (-),score=10.82 TRINITY_DN30440_c0_g1_i1:667-1488(-)